MSRLVAGEEENRKLMFVLCLSGKYPDPRMKQVVVVAGQPGSGKTHLANICTAFKAKLVGRFTAHALDYADLEGYEVLYLKELGELDRDGYAPSTLKFVSADDGGYVVEYVVRGEAGRLRTEARRVPAVTLVTTTTRVLLDRQFMRRAWILNTDESSAQTERVLAFKAELERQQADVELGLRDETDYDRAMRVLRALVERIRPVKVVVPFPGAIGQLLSSDFLRARSDYDKLVALIKLLGMLYQRRLPKLGGDVVLATPRLILKALEVAREPLLTMSTQLDHRVRSMLRALKAIGLASRGAEIGQEERRRLAEALGKSERTVMRYLDLMVELGYASRRVARPATYVLVRGVDEILARASAIERGAGHSIVSMAWRETWDFVCRRVLRGGGGGESLLKELLNEAVKDLGYEEVEEIVGKAIR
ncbi:hypothetical protein B6U99_07805 [Candidatus Geothermarchaeota archaeon ex4572_27]|nr:MAG: hypothetical protein B6U99_07805 [Candidatus Geothermarchaeota archaeon ex4572_27]